MDVPQSPLITTSTQSNIPLCTPYRITCLVIALVYIAAQVVIAQTRPAMSNLADWVMGGAITFMYVTLYFLADAPLNDSRLT